MFSTKPYLYKAVAVSCYVFLSQNMEYINPGAMNFLLDHTDNFAVLKFSWTWFSCVHIKFFMGSLFWHIRLIHKGEGNHSVLSEVSDMLTVMSDFPYGQGCDSWGKKRKVEHQHQDLLWHIWRETGWKDKIGILQGRDANQSKSNLTLISERTLGLWKLPEEDKREQWLKKLILGMDLRGRWHCFSRI